MATARGKTEAKPKRAKKPAEKQITSIKGFDRDLKCRGYQFEIGKTFTHEGAVEVCGSGFHACTTDAHPLSVFEYYAPGQSRYCEVVQTGPFSTNDDVKISSAKITIGVELSISELTKRAIEWVFARAKKEKNLEHSTGPRGAASATGYYGAASATGPRGAASATGPRGAASATGEKSTAMACGYDGRVSAAKGNALFALERDGNWNIVSTASGIAGKDGIKPDTFYRCKGGKLVEAK